MRQTWRWFGPKDTVSVDDMLQAGVEGVVSALHHIPNGEIWPVDEIQKRQRQISHRADGTPTNLEWEVVESLPVSEDIKKQDGEWQTHIANYITSMENLARSGIQTICYNFMPVLDWTRTDLSWKLKNGARCMRFDYIDFAAFDIFILNREGSAESFAPDLVEMARDRHARFSDEQKQTLTNNIVAGLPGANQQLQLKDIKILLSAYAAIDENRLRRNHHAFMEEIVPAAEKLNIRLCCHPDDPPFSLLGLPRIMSNESDYRKLVEAVDSPTNGITLCSGSLGAQIDCDLPGMMRRLGDKVHFLHLRNVVLEDPGGSRTFHESEHLKGNTDMVALIASVLAEERKRKQNGRPDWNIPMRPDHGHDILSDIGCNSQPGYPAIGRLKGLAELRGVSTALSSLPTQSLSEHWQGG